jgi:hypothetical protein
LAVEVELDTGTGFLAQILVQMVVLEAAVAQPILFLEVLEELELLVKVLLVDVLEVRLGIQEEAAVAQVSLAVTLEKAAEVVLAVMA